MTTFWVTFNDKSNGSVDAETNEAALDKAREVTGKEPVSALTIPYPSRPVLHSVPHEKWGICPAFCYRPERCVGRTSCPNNPSCTE
jgi:hypothetical protein